MDMVGITDSIGLLYEKKIFRGYSMYLLRSSA
jgi:hypothetical protein